MPKKPKPFPKCDAPMCSEDAWHQVSASGDNAFFEGYFCAAHYDNFKVCFPARMSSVALLRAVSLEALEAIDH